VESDRISPVIGLLQAISPDPDRPDNEILTYPSLDRAAKTTRSLEEVLLHTYQEAEDDSASQQTAAIKLAEYELIETAHELQRAQTPVRQHELSQQFTSASINIFGSPNRVIVAYLLEQLLTELCVLQTNYNVDARLLDTLTQTYGDILDRSQTPREYVLPFDEAVASDVARQFGQYLREQYPEPLDVFAGDAARYCDAREVVERFDQALSILQAQDSTWRQWCVRVTDDANLSVNSAAKRIIVGANRAGIELGELQGLFAHEVMVHAQRAHNGERLGNGFSQGLPGFINAEEGLGCFVEHALTGEAPVKMYDRYMDVALALGTLNGHSHTRKQLFTLVHARTKIRAQATGRQVDESCVERASWTHVNRIFRGTLGNDIVGVFTKDVAYYEGYQKIVGFVIEELRSGASVEELWSLLVAGKFDPTDSSHMVELMRLGY